MQVRYLRNILLAAAMLGSTPCRAAVGPHQLALQLLSKAAAAQGGEDALRRISTIEWTAHGYRNMLEQSERPEGPYIPEFRDVEEWHDHTNGRFRSMARISIYPDFKGAIGILADQTAAMRIGLGGPAAAGADDLTSAREALALAPERLLLTAMAAPDARLERRRVMQSIPQDVVRFTLDGSPVRIFINAQTHLPTAFDYSGPFARDGYWRFRGDVTMRTYWSYWWLGQGVRMPLQSDVYRNGLHDSSLIVETLSVNAAFGDAQMKLPDDIREKFREAISSPPQAKLGQTLAIAPGVMFIPGRWNVLLVRQTDGIVVIEAPISSAYSELILAEAERQFPGIPVKAMVSTSDAWPHVAGIRPYIARGIPIYCLDLNRPLLERTAADRYANEPDALQKAPVKPRFRPFAMPTVLGNGRNRIELVPLRGETLERQAVAYFPALRLLYASDAFQIDDRGQYHSAEGVAELLRAVRRNRFAPRTLVMMHVSPRPWNEIEAAGPRPDSGFPQGATAAR